MDEDQSMKEVLDKFVNCHEQTYEEFSTAPAHDMMLPTFSVDSPIPIITPTSVSGSLSPQAILAPVKLTFSVNNHTNLSMVNSFLDLEDLDMDEESKPQASTDVLLLPGEVEQDLSTSVPACAPRVQQPPTSEVKPKPTVEKTQKKHIEEILGDEVQPFCLDEEFDYGNVALTPKFTFEEIETIKKLSEQKTKDASLD